MALDDAKLAQLRSILADRLQDMQQDLQVQGAPGFAISSGYRSPEHQAELYSAAVAKYGSPDAARKWVAPPGHSMHNEGLAADLSFDPGAGPEVHALASQYGLKFPMPYENWHIEPQETRGGGTIPAPTDQSSALAFAPQQAQTPGAAQALALGGNPQSQATPAAPLDASALAALSADPKSAAATQYQAVLGSLSPKQPAHQFSQVRIQGLSPEQANGLSKLAATLKARMI